MPSDLIQLQTQLKAAGQEQVLRFWQQLSSEGRGKLQAQLGGLDLALIAELAQGHVRQGASAALPGDIRPAQAYPRKADASLAGQYQRAEARGREMLAAGKIGAFLVAGGQGTRLGFDGPKGQFQITPIKNKPLFQVFAEQLLAHGRLARRAIPWYVMTSDVNDAATRAYFNAHGHFGYEATDVFFFVQGMMPAFSLEGQMLLEAPDSLALSPDGHGGCLRAMARSGALADMRDRGVEHLSYFQVDNPLVHCVDTLFLGLHDLTGSEMSSKTIPKSDALERVGNFVIADGKLAVIEYSDLPEALARSTNPDGSLRFNAGSIAIHALSVAFIERLNAGGKLRLPWHRAVKKVPTIDEAGRVVTPGQPNAVKLEQFVFDAIPLAKNAMVYTTDRAEEFSPVKNAQGGDSPQTCRRDQVRRAAAWLGEAGVSVPTDAVVEISPLFAPTGAELGRRDLRSLRIKAGEKVYLEQ